MNILKRLAILLPSMILPALGSPVQLEQRDPPNTLEALTSTFEHLLYFSKGIAQEITLLESALKDVKSGKITPINSTEEALTSLSNISNSTSTTTQPPSIITLATNLLLNGLAPQNILDLIATLANSEINSSNNTNPDLPTGSPPIYPKKEAHDAPYSQPESSLRSAIYIPKTFEYGANNRTPVLLIPGTADPAGTTYAFSYAKLLKDSPYADPIWLNIPGNSLGDIQVNAEYVAYAINYISSLTTSGQVHSNDTSKRTQTDSTSLNSTSPQNISILSWSQGGIDAQWALKYWPSTRIAVPDFLALSADFHGTLFEAGCLVSGSPLCTPAIRQQGYNSNLIHALRGEDGDSAYVPTTSVYSGVDEIVQPQQGVNASAYLSDIRGVGVTNVQIQVGCQGRGRDGVIPVGGGFYLHETMLVNPLAYALFMDALMHEGPGDLGRIDLDGVCEEVLAPGLGVEDLLGTEVMALVFGAVDTLSYGGSGDDEPPLMDYV